MVVGPTDALQGFPDDPFALTPEQRHIAGLLERLLGRAIANRYADFLRLASSDTGLRAARPMAAHALRELDSMIRDALEVPLEAKAAENEQDTVCLKEALKLLKDKGYDEQSLQRAEKALKPRHSHATEIKLIGARLGLSDDSDIIRAWLSLTKAVGRAHERHFHHSMAVDDAFRTDFQKPLDLVLGSILVALQKRYAAFMSRVEAIAAMPDRAKALRLFETEIPGAMPLQWHFYQNIHSPDWLPQLLKHELVREPVLDDDTAGVREYGPWPVGHYLLNLAKSGDVGAIPHLVEGLRAVQTSPHPAVKRTGLEVITFLPPAVANDLVDVVIGWLDQDTPGFYYVAPNAILKRLAENGHVESALKIARGLFRVIDRAGEIASIHPDQMYEHHLPSAVNILASRDGLSTVRLLSDILLEAARIGNKVQSDDYSYMTPHPLSDNQMAQYGIWEALVIAVRDAAIVGCQAEPAMAAEIVGDLAGRPLKIFRRIALHVLSKNAAAVPHLAAEFLVDTDLIGESWCEDEYAELAVAHFPQLLPQQQQSILASIDALPDHFREAWRENFTAHHNAKPTAEDERRYDIAVLQEAMWKWRSVLPPDRQRLLEESEKLFGDPEAWHRRLFPPEFSPLTPADFAARPMQDILALLRSFAPSEEPVRHTINALGQQLREAVAQEPARFARAADAFADVRPIYVRRLLEGFETPAANGKSLQWGPILNLIRAVAERLKRSANVFPQADGDDEDWYPCCLAAARLLETGLGHVQAGLTLDQAPQIEDIITTFFDEAPRQPSAPDFEAAFAKHQAFTAGQSLWGSATELCLRFLWWNSRQAQSPVAKEPRSAFRLLPQMASLLERGLTDHSTWGRIPRAVMGRRLTWLAYFGKEWLTQQMPLLFPKDEALRRATWLAHLTSDTAPIRSRVLTQFLLPIYDDEIARLDGDLTDDAATHRATRLGDYLLVLWIAERLPDATMDAFLARAPGHIRRHSVGYLGRTLQLPHKNLPEESRARARRFWEKRLAAGIAASKKDHYREELGAIGQWFIRDAINIEAAWLFDQLLQLFRAGFAPSNGYSLIDWLGKIAASCPAKAVAVFAEMLSSAQLARGTYLSHTEPIRTILQQGLLADVETVHRTRDLISVLATVGQSGYLDLLRAGGEGETFDMSILPTTVPGGEQQGTRPAPDSVVP